MPKLHVSKESDWNGARSIESWADNGRKLTFYVEDSRFSVLRVSDAVDLADGIEEHEIKTTEQLVNHIGWLVGKKDCV
jgi:hypothetical protein